MCRQTRQTSFLKVKAIFKSSSQALKLQSDTKTTTDSKDTHPLWPHGHIQQLKVLLALLSYDRSSQCEFNFNTKLPLPVLVRCVRDRSLLINVTLVIVAKTPIAAYLFYVSTSDI